MHDFSSGGESVGRTLSAGKKREEACASSPCRSIGTPLTRHCRCLKAFPTPTGPQHSVPGLRSRAFYARLLYRRPLAHGCFDLHLRCRRFPGLAPFPPVDRSGLRLPDRGIFRLAPSVPDPDPAEAFSGSRRSAVCTASGLQALRGFRLLASISRDRVSLSSHPTWYGRHLQSPARVTCSVPLEH
jgi:hypothetical protein